MQELDLAIALAERRKTTGPPLGQYVKAYEIISDHMVDDEPRWHGLFYNNIQKPEIISNQRHQSLQKTIEELRKKHNGTTHFTIASNPNIVEPFLYKVAKIQDSSAIEQFDWIGCKWNPMDNGDVKDRLASLHHSILWPGFFSYNIYVQRPCMSIVLGYKTSGVVIGIWAFHAMLVDAAACQQNLNTYLLSALYPPISCLNAALVDRFVESGSIRRDLALLAHRAIVGRNIEEKALRRDIRQNPSHISKIVKDVINGSFAISPDRSHNYRKIFDQLLAYLGSIASVEIEEPPSYIIQSLRDLFVGWHLWSRYVYNERALFSDACLFIERAISRLNCNSSNELEPPIQTCLEQVNQTYYLQSIARLIFRKIHNPMPLHSERLAFLLLVRTIMECDDYTTNEPIREANIFIDWVIDCFKVDPR